MAKINHFEKIELKENCNRSVMSTQVYFFRRSSTNKFSSIFDQNLKFLRDPITEPGLYYLKKSYNKMDSQNESQLNRIKKSPFLLIQED